jgi:hypothetical protein
MRGEYLNLLDRLSRGEVYHLARSVDETQKTNDVQALQDRFLDLFLEWKRSGDAAVRGEIETLVTRIRAMDPDFTFEFPRSREAAG